VTEISLHQWSPGDALMQSFQQFQTQTGDQLMIYEGKAITVKEIEGGIAQLNFDLQGESVNKFNRLTIEELRAATDKLEAQKGLKGLVVTSSKDSFIVGADINEFTELFAGPEEDLVANNLKANEVFSAIEDLPFPTVTAINGIALGGGCEMCLATDYRVSNRKLKSACPKSSSAFFRVLAALFVCRAWSVWITPSSGSVVVLKTVRTKR